MDKVICECGTLVSWTFAWHDEDGDWFEQTCPKCGCKINLKCVLSEETKEILGGDVFVMKEIK